ncbi:hypothetical protein EDD22DRAFT_845232 [Suillus occidentalis]|nr:hypothetical protein EDD22DRAFT_845232 [Suillus occidentalis]
MPSAALLLRIYAHIWDLLWLIPRCDIASLFIICHPDVEGSIEQLSPAQLHVTGAVFAECLTKAGITWASETSLHARANLTCKPALGPSKFADCHDDAAILYHALYSNIARITYFGPRPGTINDGSLSKVMEQKIVAALGTSPLLLWGTPRHQLLSHSNRANISLAYGDSLRRGTHFFQYYPAIIGEEATVTVKAVGDGAADFMQGTRVLSSYPLPCTHNSLKD